MTHHADNWMKKTERWFAAHPERNFMTGRIPVSALPGVSGAGWIAAVASQVSAPGSAVTPTVAKGEASIDCIVRRADPAAGRPLPGVLLLDFGRGRLPLVPPTADPARGAELLAEWLWGLAQVAAAADVPLWELLQRQIRRAS